MSGKRSTWANKQTAIPASSELNVDALTSDQSSTVSFDSISQVGSVSLRDDLRKVNSMISFLKNYSSEKKNSKNKSKSVGNKGKVKIHDRDDKIVKCLDCISGMTARILSVVEDLQKKTVTCMGTHAPATNSSFADIVRLQINENIVPYNWPVKKLEGRIDELEQDLF